MAKFSKVSDTDKGWHALEAVIAQNPPRIRVGVIGAAASRVHPPPQSLDKKTENFLNNAAEKGNTDAVLQLQAMRSDDATKRIKHVFKPGPTMGEIGEIHEYGLGNNPARSWLRGYVDDNADKISKKLRRVAIEVCEKRMSAEQGLNLVGLSVVGGIKKRIQAGIEPPLAASTLARKGPTKTTPLINTGAFIGSISHELVPAGTATKRA